MKITKSFVKQIIKEELQKLTEMRKGKLAYDRYGEHTGDPYMEPQPYVGPYAPPEITPEMQKAAEAIGNAGREFDRIVRSGTDEEVDELLSILKIDDTGGFPKRQFVQIPMFRDRYIAMMTKKNK